MALPPADANEILARHTGLRMDWRHAATLPAAAGQWAGEHRAGRPVLVLGDAYHLPWLPYAGREHMTHSFVVERLSGQEAAVADAYHNATTWGTAQPGTWTVPLDVLATATGTADGVRWGVLTPAGPPSPRPALTQVQINATAILEAEAAGDFDHFTRSYAAAYAAPATAWPDPAAELVTQTWLLARSRALHQGWLTEVAERSGQPWLRTAARQFAETVVPRWQRAATSVYVTLRRGRTGPAVADGVARVLTAAGAAERELAHLLRRGAEGDDVHS